MDDDVIKAATMVVLGMGAMYFGGWMGLTGLVIFVLYISK